MTFFPPRYEILPEAQQAILPLLAEVPKRFVLYGGTAMALQLAHRTSVDFDFFSSDPFVFDDLRQELPWLSESQIIQRAENTLTVIAGAPRPVKISFFGGLRIGRVSEPRMTDDRRFLVASLLDLAGLKAAVVQQRAEAKDYLDIGALLRQGISLAEALGAALALYPETFNPMVTLKALGYFEDGDLKTLPLECKETLRQAASNVGKIPEIQRVSNSISS